MKRILRVAEYKRSFKRDVALGLICAFVAGAINAGGFVAVGQYTSHVTGMTARLADGIGLRQFTNLSWIFWGISSFLFGSVWASLLVQMAAFWRLHSRYALALLGSGMTLILLSFYSVRHHSGFDKEILSLGFFFSMGMQNATVSKLTNFQIRATHMTGIVTDIGIELGYLLFGNTERNKRTLFVLIGIFASFLVGGILGAVLFSSWLKLWSLLIFGGILVFLSLLPILHDSHVRLRWNRIRK